MSKSDRKLFSTDLLHAVQRHRMVFGDIREGPPCCEMPRGGSSSRVRGPSRAVVSTAMAPADATAPAASAANQFRWSSMPSALPRGLGLADRDLTTLGRGWGPGVRRRQLGQGPVARDQGLRPGTGGRALRPRAQGPAIRGQIRGKIVILRSSAII